MSLDLSMYPNDRVPVYYLLKGKAISLQFGSGEMKSFAPLNYIQKSEAEKLLTKQITVGGCCNHPSRTFFLFATEEQLNSGERTWIEG